MCDGAYAENVLLTPAPLKWKHKCLHTSSDAHLSNTNVWLNGKSTQLLASADSTSLASEDNQRQQQRVTLVLQGERIS